MPQEGAYTPRQSKGFRSFLSRTFSAFAHRDFRLMWTGAFLSTIGTHTQIIAQAWLVFELSNSPFILGLTAFLGELPFLLFTLIGGAVADRIDRRKLLLVSQLVQMATALLLTLLVYSESIEIWHFLVLVFVVGTAQAFGGPAYQALLPSLVPRQLMANAIALNSIQFNLARMTGPILAGILMASVGAVVCFAFNAVSFLAVITSLLLIRSKFSPQRTGTSVFRDIAHGVSYLYGQGALAHLTILGFIAAFCGIPLLTMLPVFAREVFHLNSAGYSYMAACSGAGSVVGGVLYANFSQLMKHKGLATLRVQLLFAAILTGFALSVWLPLSLSLLFIGGVGMLTLIASINSLIQLATSDEMRGRVMSIFMLSFRGAMPLGNLFAGALAARLGPGPALLINSLLMAITALAFLVSRSGIKKL